MTLMPEEGARILKRDAMGRVRLPRGKRGTGQISGESGGKRGWDGHRGCKPSSPDASEGFYAGIHRLIFGFHRALLAP
jgi:hypothetical protein